MHRPNHHSRRPQRRRKPSDPVLMGEPSPALTKIARMNTEKLTEHIKTMEVEAERLKTKIKNLLNMTPPEEQRAAQLTQHRKRLEALITAARERLDGKLERAEQYKSTGYTRSTGYKRR